MTETQVPLEPEQVEAAQTIYASSNHAESWRRTDAAIAALRDAMPSFDASSTLVKVVVVNSLYGANLYVADSAALHIKDVVDSADDSFLRSPELVEKIAAIPPRPGASGRMHRSFASKFAHFFIDHDCFPIYDSFAAKMLRAHLGGSHRPPTAELPTWLSRVPSEGLPSRLILARTPADSTATCG